MWRLLGNAAFDGLVVVSDVGGAGGDMLAAYGSRASRLVFARDVVEVGVLAGPHLHAFGIFPTSDLGCYDHFAIGRDKVLLTSLVEVAFPQRRSA